MKEIRKILYEALVGRWNRIPGLIMNGGNGVGPAGMGSGQTNYLEK
jgi:hypothetical protein